MHSHITLLQQLPQSLQREISAHLGSTAGMSEVQIVTRYKDVAWWLKSVKLASLPAGYVSLGTHLTVQEFNNMGSPQAGVAQSLVDMMNHLMASEGAWHLDNFVHQLLTIINQLHEAARLHAQRQAEEAARQLAQRQAEEAARQLAQRQAEEAARLHAQRLAEEAARQLAQRQAEEAAQLAARQLAEQQAYAAAQALMEQKAQEAAIQAARLALELATAATIQPPETPVSTEHTPTDTSKTGPTREVVFIPGPAAMAEIDRATLVLKHSIDAAVALYASAVGPHLNTTAA